MKNKKESNVQIEKSNTHIQAWIEIGYIYGRLEQQLNAIGDKTGGEVSGLDAAHWMGTTLLSKARRGILDGTQHLPKVRGGTSEGDEITPSEETVHVRPRDNRALETCRQCGKSFKDRSSRMLHQVEKHGLKLRGRFSKKEKEEKPKKRWSGPVMCGVCKKLFPSRSAQMKHRVKVHGYKVSNDEVSHKQAA